MNQLWLLSCQHSSTGFFCNRDNFATGTFSSYFHSMLHARTPSKPAAWNDHQVAEDLADNQCKVLNSASLES